MRFHGFVDVEARKRLYIKASKPHGADKDHAQFAVGGVGLPLGEGDLVLARAAENILDIPSARARRGRNEPVHLSGDGARAAPV